MKVIWCQEWGLFLLEGLFHNVTAMRKREMSQHLQRCPHSHQSTTAEEMAPIHLSMRGLLGSTNDEILEVAEEVYCGWYGVVLSILPCWHQDQFMAEHHEGLDQCLIRAGLCGAMRAARFLSRGRRCSHAHSSSQAWLPSLSTHGCEGTSASLWYGHSHMWAHWSPSTGPVQSWEHPQASFSGEGQTPSCSPARLRSYEAINAKWPCREPMIRHSQSRHRCSCHRNRFQQCQSPL